jgi:hypothetical protein
VGNPPGACSPGALQPPECGYGFWLFLEANEPRAIPTAIPRARPPGPIDGMSAAPIPAPIAIPIPTFDGFRMAQTMRFAAGSRLGRHSAECASTHAPAS